MPPGTAAAAFATASPAASSGSGAGARCGIALPSDGGLRRVAHCRAARRPLLDHDPPPVLTTDDPLLATDGPDGLAVPEGDPGAVVLLRVVDGGRRGTTQHDHGRTDPDPAGRPPAHPPPDGRPPTARTDRPRHLAGLRTSLRRTHRLAHRPPLLLARHRTVSPHPAGPSPGRYGGGQHAAPFLKRR
ncbi:hypothetical protein ACFQ1I_05715 [Kitasatospora arboriphila]